MTKDGLQAKAAKAWFDSGCRGTILLGTGCGKSKVALDILKAITFKEDAKILLLSNSEHLRDKGWMEEFEKWGMLDTWANIASECYQSVHKWKDTKWDLIIADEIDFSLTAVYSRFYMYNSCDRFLGLTGTITVAKEETYLDKFAPICFRYTTNQAQADGILNKTKLHLVKFFLSTAKDIKVDYKDKRTKKKKSFKTSENDQYMYATQRVSKTYRALKEAEAAGDILDIAKCESMYRNAINTRKTLLHTLNSSVQITKKIQRGIFEDNPSSKILCFSGLNAQLDKFCSVTYTGKNKKGNQSLDNLNTGKINVLGVCAIIDRGANLVGVNNIIMESYVGSDTAFQQRNGRGCRLDKDDTMNLYILLPYYRIKSDSLTDPYELYPTQAVTWAQNMLKGFSCNETVVKEFI